MVDRNTGNKRPRSARRGADFRFGDAPESDGIILSCDRPERSGITPRGFVLLLAAFMAFKGAVIAHIGAVPHVEAIRSLQSGGVLDRAAAFLLAPDPVSLLISDWFDLLLR